MGALVDGLDLAADHPFARGLGDQLGPAFSANGRPGDLGALAVVDRREAGRDHLVTLADPATDLHLHLRYERFPEHGAVMVGAAFENRGRRPIAHLTDLRPLDLAINLAAVGHPTVHTLGGGVTHWIFPPLAFQLDARRIAGAVSPVRPLSIDSGGTGRSSDKNLPFFYVCDEEERSGLFVGVEWSGLWRAEFYRHGDLAGLGARQGDVLGVRLTIEELDLTLRPGERVDLPRALIGFFEGDLEAGRNRLRRFIRAWYPRLDGQELVAPVYWNHYFTFACNFDEAGLRRQADVCAELGIEYFQVDAGWYAGCRPELGGPGYQYGVGNWEQVDPARFPNGVRPFADYVRAKGMRYATWFDPERAHPSSQLAREHPDWVLYVDEADAATGRPGGAEWGLVDFGRPDVQAYFLDLLQRRIDEFGIEWLKWDNNINPRAYWNAHDDPTHRGLKQLAHIRGVYRVWSEIGRANPTMVFENCSSGGRRLDLGAFANAHLHFSSDFNHDSDIVRTQYSGANTVIPTHRLISTCTQGPESSPSTYFHSRFGGVLRFSQDFASWSKPALERVREHVEVYKSVRRYLAEDFYPLFEQPRSLRSWDGWQYHDPASGDGFLLAFRLRADESTRRPRLRGLVAGQRYRLTDPYSGQERTLDGRELRDDGLPLELERDGSTLLRYQPAR